MLDQKQEQFARFDRLGEVAVEKLVLSFDQPVRDLAFEWLRAREVDRQSSLLRDRARARRMDVIAITIATVAMIMATIGAVPTIKAIIEHLSNQFGL